jgi:hypothetical protein
MKSISPANVICYCEPGATAAYDLLAIAYADPGMEKLQIPGASGSPIRRNLLLEAAEQATNNSYGPANCLI